MESQNGSVADIINGVETGNMQDANVSFAAVMQQKIDDSLAQAKELLAQTMFSSNNQAEEN